MAQRQRGLERGAAGRWVPLLALLVLLQVTASTAYDHDDDDDEYYDEKEYYDEYEDDHDDHDGYQKSDIKWGSPRLRRLPNAEPEYVRRRPRYRSGKPEPEPERWLKPEPERWARPEPEAEPEPERSEPEPEPESEPEPEHHHLEMVQTPGDIKFLIRVLVAKRYPGLSKPVLVSKNLVAPVYLKDLLPKMVPETDYEFQVRLSDHEGWAHKSYLSKKVSVHSIKH